MKDYDGDDDPGGDDIWTFKIKYDEQYNTVTVSLPDGEEGYSLKERVRAAATALEYCNFEQLQKTKHDYVTTNVLREGQ